MSSNNMMLGRGDIEITLQDGTRILMPNCSMEVNLETERLEHVSLRGGERVVDQSVEVGSICTLTAIGANMEVAAGESHNPTVTGAKLTERLIKFGKESQKDDTPSE